MRLVTNKRAINILVSLLNMKESKYISDHLWSKKWTHQHLTGKKFFMLGKYSSTSLIITVWYQNGVKTDDFYEDIKNYVEERYDIFNCDEKRRKGPLLVGKTKN